MSVTKDDWSWVETKSYIPEKSFCYPCELQGEIPTPSPLDGQIPTPQNFVHCNFEICILEGLVPSDAFHSGVALKMNELSQDNVKLLR